MGYSYEAIAASLKQARLAKGWTQRELSARTHIPQSHISRIEKGAVDLQLSSLIELARALDRDVELVPRSLLKAVMRMNQTADSDAPRPAYTLDDED